jgi:hypothetical protein
LIHHPSKKKLLVGVVRFEGEVYTLAFAEEIPCELIYFDFKQDPPLR